MKKNKLFEKCLSEVNPDVRKEVRENMENPLAFRYKEVCNAYRDALNEMWDTNGEWLDNNLWWFDVADCAIGIEEVRECVDRKVDFDTFLEWYDYDTQIHYAESIGKSVNHINLHTWINGYPEELKVPQEKRDKWEREYWASLVGAE